MGASEIPSGVAAQRYAERVGTSHSVTWDIPIGLLIEPLDPMRHNMDDDDMSDLQNSIRTTGLLENLCVVPVLHDVRVTLAAFNASVFENHVGHGGQFRVAAGHRRLLACRAVGHNPVRCEVFFDDAIDEEEIMHGENMHREEPTDFDLAVLYNKWLKKPGMTEAELKRLSGKSLDYVYGRAALLEGYEDVAKAIHAKQITFSVARLLNQIKDASTAARFLRMAIDQGATGTLVKAWIKEYNDYAECVTKQNEAGPQPIPITAPKFTAVECLLCGDRQSYNLQSVLLCHSDVERIKAAREQVENTGQPQGDNGGGQ